MRVVIDTNAWVSRLLLSSSTSARAVDRALDDHEVVVSDALIEELADVLSREKFDRYISLADREEFPRRVLRIARTIPVLSIVEDCRDPDDNRLLALALDSESEVVLTGDRDLLSLHPWRGIALVPPHEFLAVYG